eukprot:CAMPEP_0178954472 /NCGR_PEP_ID=MMETSP0789-20121207/9009_1 /TAXON_ID=3005 /ORGANISM="Rhizosolenia setigera, Strain CCMP 1694" /LENGTH=444 /DNA_ID=CAMNT_0020635877 /DNA_START=301 /DNA_END=1638 /DNA_ORIENTATION=+
MSRRRGEFEHRTSIFEGAYRAWCFFGRNIELSSLEKSESVSDLASPIFISSSIPEKDVGDLYKYEALPRSGLRHPFIPAILSYWLGKDAKNHEITQGLQTLRTWWQHRRKGESNTAKELLGTDEMKALVKKYTLTFFDLIYSVVKLEKGTPPPSITKRIKDLKVAEEDRKRKRMQQFMDEKIQSLVINTNANRIAGSTFQLPAGSTSYSESSTSAADIPQSSNFPMLPTGNDLQSNFLMAMSGYPYQQQQPNNPYLLSQQSSAHIQNNTMASLPSYPMPNVVRSTNNVDAQFNAYNNTLVSNSCGAIPQNDLSQPPSKVVRMDSSPFSSRSSSSSSLEEDSLQQQENNMQLIFSDCNQSNESFSSKRQSDKSFERAMSLLSQFSIDWDHDDDVKSIIKSDFDDSDSDYPIAHPNIQEEKAPFATVQTSSYDIRKGPNTLYSRTA